VISSFLVFVLGPIVTLRDLAEWTESLCFPREPPLVRAGAQHAPCKSIWQDDVSGALDYIKIFYAVKTIRLQIMAYVLYCSCTYVYRMRRSWSVADLRLAVKHSQSYRQTLGKLQLRQAGGNYEQLKKYIKEYKIPHSHFKGKGWNKGLHIFRQPIHSLESILKKGTLYQTFKLKKRLFAAGLKKPQCELCKWAKRSIDGRLPLELDHVNGDSKDNRLENLRILCPNCHSLQTTHRGKNIRVKTKRTFQPG